MQLIIYTYATGELLYSAETKPNPYYNNANEYLKNGWRVTTVAGVGLTSSQFNRGSFCMVLEKDDIKIPMP